MNSFLEACKYKNAPFGLDPVHTSSVAYKMDLVEDSDRSDDSESDDEEGDDEEGDDAISRRVKSVSAPEAMQGSGE